MICGKHFMVEKFAIRNGHGFCCSRSCGAIHHTIHSTKQGTSIEIKLAQELTRQGIVFKSQYPIWQAKTIPDFFVEPNIVIYADGDYWHNRHEAKLKDEQQNFMLKFLGYKVYRFWEHEINNNVCACVHRITNDTQKNLKP